MKHTKAQILILLPQLHFPVCCMQAEIILRVTSMERVST